MTGEPGIVARKSWPSPLRAPDRGWPSHRDAGCSGPGGTAGVTAAPPVSIAGEEAGRAHRRGERLQRGPAIRRVGGRGVGQR